MDCLISFHRKHAFLDTPCCYFFVDIYDQAVFYKLGSLPKNVPIEP
jgi:hypothetical protein